MVTFFSLFFLLMLVLPTNTRSATAQVVIEMDKNDIVCDLEENGSYTANVLGNVECVMDGYGQDFQYIEVLLFCGNARGISTDVSPSKLFFYSNGEERFNLTVHVSETVINGTEMELVVRGTWQAKNIYGRSAYGSSGEAIPDSVNLTVYRESYTHYSTAVSGPIGGPTSLTDVPDFWPFLTMVAIPLVVVVVLVVFLAVRWRRKRRRRKVKLRYRS